MAKKSTYNPVRKGTDPRNSGGSGEGYGFIRISPGESIDITCLVDAEEIITTEQCAIWLKDGNQESEDGSKVKSPVWVYTGPEDPSHDLNGVTKSYRAFLPVLQDGEVKIWPMGKMAHGQVLDIYDASGDLTGMVLRLKRTGSGLGTRYSVVPTGKRKDVSTQEEVDVISVLGPLTPEGVRELIAERLQLNDYDEVLEKYRGKALKPVESKPKAKARSKKPVVVEEDDDDDEDLLLEDDDEEEDDK